MLIKLLYTFENYNYEDLKYVQPYQFERKAVLLLQMGILKIFGVYAPEYAIKDLILLLKHISIKRSMIIFWGTVKRIINGAIR